jgi:alpha-galactosidase
MALFLFRLPPGKAAWAIALLLGLCSAANALDDGLARTPPMGWNSWNHFQLNISEGLVRETVDAITTNGMRSAGYQFIVVDAGWKAKQRDANRLLAADPGKFPSGMKALADYVHSKGLKFGLYTDAGAQDCVAGTPGSKGFEALDAATFAGWGVDFLKEDWCNTEGMNAKESYARMHEALVANGRPMVFSVCEWGDNQPWGWAPDIAHMWRTTGDIKDCWDCGQETMKRLGGYPRGWTLILDAQPPLRAYAGPGHWNDPDMLVVGMPGLSTEEARAHFSLWCVLAAPLICGCDVRAVKPEIAEILLNREVIAVDQDPLGVEGTLFGKKGDVEVWMKPPHSGGKAVALFNRGQKGAKITVSFTDLEVPYTARFQVRDLWKHQDLGGFRRAFTANVVAHGVVMVKFVHAQPDRAAHP